MPTPNSNYTLALAAVNPPQPPPAGQGNPGWAIAQATAIALQADEAASITGVAGSGQSIQGSALALKALAAAAAPTVTSNGTTGATTYTYKIVAKVGLRPAPVSAGGSTTTGNATLSAANPSGIAFTCVPYASSYDIYRTTGGSTQGKIGNVLQPASVVSAFPTSLNYQSTSATASFVDTGLTADGSTAPTVGLTGLLQADAHSDIQVVGLTTPYGLVVSNPGTAGSTNYTYVVSAVSPSGEAPCAGVQTTTGNATLTTTNSNLLTWYDVPGAQAYNIYRSAASGTPSTAGLIGTVYPNGSATYGFNDTGIAIITANVPTTNTTGGIATAGPAAIAGLLLSGPAPSANTTASGGATYTVANMLTNVLLRSGGGAQTDTTPTAAAIINGLRASNAAGVSANVQVGMGWCWFVRNALTGTCTLGQAATGITWTTGTNTVATVAGHLFYIQLTNVTQGSEAITISSIIGSVAY
jgi:hypothetical protein